LRSVLIYSDITERKKAEEEIRAARDAAEAALERQSATADILRVIASSPTDVQPVLDAVAKAAVRFCGATDAVINVRDGDEIVRMAHEGPLPTSVGTRRPLARDSASTRAIHDSRIVHHPDIAALDPLEFATGHRLAAQYGYRAALAAPMLREGTAIGNIVLRKADPGAFTAAQITLLETFAAQAVIAIENVRLFTELRDSLVRLKAAQANLVQSEKMASLGQLTAGIAHEIKNPLNFVNNFATLSVDLLDELKGIAGPALETLDEDKRAELDETMGLLTGNLGKIAEHGKRADGIVKSMLSHSRGGSGDWQASDINALVEEALNLAYHGARAQDKEFNVTLERDFEKDSKPIELVPQDVTRVFLNLFGNGFYAANKRRLAREAGFRPTLTVSTRDLGETVEVKVRDNGIGIPPDVRDKLFQPFFTTKPTGEGTGLGLSISYDIVTQQHGGTIGVESEVGNFTEFTVRLPRVQRVASHKRA
jgi:signal transduction histidine kinase